MPSSPSATLPPSITPTSTPSPISTDPAARLRAYPILANSSTDAGRAIIAAGSAAGRRTNVFTTIGDSNTTNGDFMQPFGASRDVCVWGSHAYLRAAVMHFSAPVANAATSFTHESAAARMGFNTAAVLDPFWASPTQCSAGETPLVCEYRRSQPAFSVIMLGGRDVLTMETAAYRDNMEQIVAQSVSAGVLPVLTTFVVMPGRAEYEKSLAFNAALLDLADAYGVPLINLWAAAEPLPDHGIGPDRSHLKARVGDYCAFNGAERELGGTLRNLLTLQMLDMLRQSYLG